MYHMSIKSISEQMTQLDSQIRCSSSHDHVSEGTGNRHETHMTVHDPLSSPLLITMNTEADAELNAFGPDLSATKLQTAHRYCNPATFLSKSMRRSPGEGTWMIGVLWGNNLTSVDEQCC